MEFRWLSFEEFSLHELYEVLALRQAVFVVEQSSPYADLDFIDQQADHLMATDETGLAGYARCYGPLPGESSVSFGRVVVAHARRNTGLGKELVRRVLARLATQSCPDVVISAQLHLEPFYARFGFVRQGKPYDDTGILHIDMHLRLREAGYYDDGSRF
jgi:ElaA protein